MHEIAGVLGYPSLSPDVQTDCTYCMHDILWLSERAAAAASGARHADDLRFLEIGSDLDETNALRDGLGKATWLLRWTVVAKDAGQSGPFSFWRTGRDLGISL